MFNFNKIPREKLLFIITSEFGELFYAYYFTQGYSFNFAYALPGSIYELNKSKLNNKSIPYHNLNDLKKIILAEKPKIIFLFSAYLYVLNNIMTHQELQELILFCRNLNISLVTNDFSLNMWPDLNNLINSGVNKNNPLQKFLIESLIISRNILKDLLHLYAVAVNNPNLLAFFNPYLLKPQVFCPALKDLKLRPPAINKKNKFWLFILAREEFIVQTEKHGEKPFIEQIASRLENAAALGRQPVLLAPNNCLNLIKKANKKINNLILLPNCSFNDYLYLLFSAEYVFYWNVFSFSIIAREFNLLPVFYFDYGHMVEKFPPLRRHSWEKYQTNREKYGWLKDEPRLSIAKLKKLAAEQLKYNKKVIARHKKIIPDTPRVIIDKILSLGRKH